MNDARTTYPSAKALNDQSGLTPEQVLSQRQKYGANSFPKTPPPTYFTIFIDQFRNPLIYMLLAAAGIIFLVGERLDAFIISGVLLFNAILGTVQEGRTAQIIEQLERLLKNDVVVIRAGQRQVVGDQELVVGDIVIMQAGARVPADLQILTAEDLQIDEAILTGEAVPVKKVASPLSSQLSAQPVITPTSTRSATETLASAAVQRETQSTSSLTDSTAQHFAFQGTYILAGFGTAQVISVGAQTQLGQLHKIVTTVEKKLPLRDELDRLSHWIIGFILAICGALLIAGLLTGKPFAELLAMLTALFICVVPEGLPVVLTLVLVSGVYRMARQQVLVKKLQAVETLGRVQVILSDKTGTLTRNEMMVVQLYVDQQTVNVTGAGYFPDGQLSVAQQPITTPVISAQRPALWLVGLAGRLLTDVELKLVSQQTWQLQGDPTEAALAVLATKLGFNVPATDTNQNTFTVGAQSYSLQQRLRFDLTRRLQAGIYQITNANTAGRAIDNKRVMSTTEPVLDVPEISEKNFAAGHTHFQLLVLGAPEAVLALCQTVPEQVQLQLAQMLARGLRIVCLAERSAAQFGELTTELQQLKFVALIGIQDAVRSDAAASVTAAQQAGLTVAMITGDHPTTALYVAQQVGIGQDMTALITGAEFMQLTPPQQLALLSTKSIFARFTPQAKFALVQLYQQQHKIVAVTGDGVNDAPALAAANVGIVMGSTGTEVAKQTADLILLNDAFSGIMYAIERGRHIFYTLKRVILYFFATNLGEVFVVTGALLWGLPVPILPAQILWLNLVTDGFLDIALSMEQLEPETLYQRWNRQSQQLLTMMMAYRILYMALMMGIGSLVIFKLYQPVSLAYARTMTLLTMAFYQWFNAWNCRSDYRSVFSLGWFSNLWLLLAATLVLALQFAVVYVPWLRWIFKTVPINWWDWLVVFGVAITVLLAEELRKWVVQRWVVD